MRGPIALAVLGSCVLLSTGRHLFDTFALDWFRNMSAQVGSTQKPAAAIRYLSSGKSDIGYISDDPNPESIYYYGLQYQVLPSVLVFSPHEKLVICHLHAPAKLAPILANNRLKVISEMGGGFFVLTPEVR